MYKPRVLLFFVAALVATAAFAQTGPDSRTATDPKSLSAPANPQAGPVPIDDLYYTRGIGGATWSPDGKEIAFTTNITGRNNIWKVNAAGGWPIQLSQSDDRQSAATWSPDGKWIVFESDRGGAETYDLFAIPANGGAMVNLTNTPTVSETNSVWSRDGKQLLITLKPKTSPVFDVGVFDMASHQSKNLSNEQAQDRAWAPARFSPDGKFAYAVRRDAAFTDSSIYRIDLGSGTKEELTPHQGKLRFDAADISPDGKTLLITADKPGGYPNVALLDVASKKITWVTNTQWQAAANDFSPDGKWITYALNEDGRTDVYIADTATRQSKKLNVPAGLNSFSGSPSAFSPDGTRLIVAHQASNQPGDLWIYDVARGQARQLSYSAVASLNPAAIPPSQLVHYKSFDGKMISAFLWLPFNLKRDGSNPGIVMPHGGPTGQTLDSFNRTAAALASRGYVCIAPNVRGSTGYGLDFQNANFKDLGGGDLQDEVYAAKFLQDTGYVDGKKIGITGGSYGGYMTLMAIGKTPDVWAAAVEQYGIINWLTMIQHEDPYLQEYEKTLLGDPVQDRAVYEAASPIKFIRNEKAPLLVLQGENDIRVPKEEAEQVVDILKQEGKTVDVHYYPQEGHGFAKRENQVDAIRRTVQWFDKYLKASQ